MTHEDFPSSQPAYEAETLLDDEYYISQDGSLWTPMQIVGRTLGPEGKTTGYLLGDIQNPKVTIQVSAEWFNANKDALRADGFVADGTKPTLERPTAVIEAADVPSSGEADLAGVALGASVKAPLEQDESLRNKAREAADYKYNQVKNFGGTHEEADAAANRVWKNFGF